MVLCGLLWSLQDPLLAPICTKPHLDEAYLSSDVMRGKLRNAMLEFDVRCIDVVVSIFWHIQFDSIVEKWLDIKIAISLKSLLRREVRKL